MFFRWFPSRAVVFLLGSVLLSVSCGGNNQIEVNTLTDGTSTAKLFVFFGDTPPPGSTVLKFEITLTSATLCPSVGSGGECQGTPQVSLISQPVEIELKQLELESAFLNLVSSPAGTFQGVKLTFASPELQIMLSDGTIQKLEAPALALDPAMITPTFDGGLTLSPDTNFGFLIDFNIFDSIQSSGDTVTGISPVVTLVKLPAISGEEIEELEDVIGRVAELSKSCSPVSGSFTLIESMTDLPIPNIHFDDKTEFDDLTCGDLANDQTVEVDLELRAGPGLQSAEFFAEEIEFVNPPDEEDMEGVVVQVNSSAEFVLLVREGIRLPPVVAGDFVTITLMTDSPATRFRTDRDRFVIPPTLSFSNGDDIMVGQRLTVDVFNGSLQTAESGCSAIGDCTATAEQVKLKKESLTARVAAIDGTRFTLDQLPSLFGSNENLRPISTDCASCFVGSIDVSTTDRTFFNDKLTGVGDLSVGDIITVRGLLFKDEFGGPEPGSGSPAMLARRVRRRAP